MITRSPRASLLRRIGFLDMYSLVRRALTRSQVAILLYHHVAPEGNPLVTSNVTPEDFEKEVAFLRRVADILPLDVLAEKLSQGQSLPSRAACITFDDGFKDNYEYAYPILRKYNAPATIFLTTGYVDKADTFWDLKVRHAIGNTNIESFAIDGLGHYNVKSTADRLGATSRIVAELCELPDKEKDLLLKKLLDELQVELPVGFGGGISLAWSEILEMSNNGISFGAHTVNHPILTKVSPEEAKNEIILSKQAIEEKLGIPCTVFAYPRGGFNEEVIRIVREAGFTCAVTTVSRLITSKADTFALGRVNVGPDFAGFKYNLSGLAQDLGCAFNFLGRK